MWLSKLQARGFAGCDDPSFDWALERVESAVDARLLDALALLSGALCPENRVRCARWMGWPDAFEEGELALGFASPEVEVGVHPSLIVEADIQLDPPLFGKIREGVLRDPERAQGLADGTLTVRVGWHFTSDRRVVRPDLLGVRLGEVPLPLTDLPKWVPPILRDVGRRILVGGMESLEVVAARVHKALLGEDLEARAAARSVLVEANVELLLRGGVPNFALANTLHPLRWGSPGLEDRVRLVELVLLQQPDTLGWDRPLDTTQREWLTERTMGPDAVLEQVILR